MPPDYVPTKLAAPGVQYLDNHLQNPQALEYDLTVQQQIGSQTVFSISYLSTLSRELPNFVNTNLVNTAAPNNNTNNGNGYTIVNYVIQPARAQQVRTSGLRKHFRQRSTIGYANPDFAAVTAVVSNINASYNALVAQIVNHTFRYIDFDANYTWSHALDQNQNESTQASTNQPIDPKKRSQYGNSNFNVPNRFVGLRHPQVSQSVQGSEEYLLDGWRLNPLVQLQNGLPYSLVTSGFPNATSPSSGWNGAGGSPAYVPLLGRDTFTIRRGRVFDLRAEKDSSSRTLQAAVDW